MHDGVIVVWSSKIVSSVFVKVIRICGINVCEIHCDVSISVRPVLFVPEADRMAEFVNDSASVHTSIALQREFLFSRVVVSSNVGPTAV